MRSVTPCKILASDNSTGAAHRLGQTSRYRALVQWAALFAAASTASLCLAQATMPASAPASAPNLPVVTTASAPAAFVEPAPEPATPSFVGTINSNRVYVRSGPGKNFYEIGQLNHGDLVNVVAKTQGWYQIAPPVGTACYVAKEFLDTDAAGTTGTTKADFVRLRAASAIHPGSDYAILTIVRKGTSLPILGTTDKYYKVAAPDKAYVYVSAEFIIAAPASSIYQAPTLRLPANLPIVAGSHGATTMPATGGADDALVVRAPASTEPATTETSTTEPQPGTTVVVVPPQPSTQYNQTAATRFENLNGITQAESVKPLAQRDCAGLLKDYEELLAMPNLPSSVKAGSQARIKMITDWEKLQKMAKEGDIANDPAFKEQQKAYEEQWKTAQEKMAELDRTGPMLAEGRLQTSNVVRAKYVLVNPATGRVAGYIDPTSPIDLSKLLGQYVGVRGSVEEDKDLKLPVIKVRTATVMAEPTIEPSR